MHRSVWAAGLLLAIAFLANPAHAQRRRITAPVDNARRIRLRGEVNPKATVENDRGAIPNSRVLSNITLALAPSDEQQKELDQLLADQQTPGSPNYHHWLTPEEFGDRFGPSPEDLDKIKSWIEQQGLTIQSVARSRTWISVTGTAAQVEAAFQTQLHEYVVDGVQHFANASEPSIPAAFDGVVRGVRGLDDFRPRPRKRVLHRPEQPTLQPNYTSKSGNHYLAPRDLATIYNFAPLYNAGINGSGQRIVIAGQTEIDVNDIRLFRSAYGLPDSDPELILIPSSFNPGTSTDDLTEADLDIEWAGAAAPNATILYVYARDVMSAVQYAIDQNLAPVVSTSYGLCELQVTNSYAATLRGWAKQANAQGITWLSASGDSGAADCAASRITSLAVDFPASTPEVTAIGGTQFNEGDGVYWKSTNDTAGGSALSYIPEAAWNDSDLQGEPSGTGGGASVLFARPSWQVGVGVPTDNVRNVPDISMSASSSHDGYLVYTGGDLFVFGGTSVPTPIYAGVTGLLNQYLVASGAQSSPGVGNMNPKLYALAQSDPDIFHDITVGDNIVTVSCPPRNRLCVATPVGYSTGVGYDQVTGLGSVDVTKLVTRWSGSGNTLPTQQSIRLSLTSNVSSIGASDVVFLVATATSITGVTPTGTVYFYVDNTLLGTAALVGSAGTATATLPVSGTQLPLGAGAITATLSGSGSDSITASTNIGFKGAGSGSTSPSIGGTTHGASFTRQYAPGMILSIFGTDLAPAVQSATSVPLPISMDGVAVTIDGVAAPLYYISPMQLNVQIPYELPVGTSATIVVNNNGQIASQAFVLSTAAPGIFFGPNGELVPTSTAARNGILSLYVTGAGVVSPAVPTGAAPAFGTALASLPKPTHTTSVAVGGVPAPILFIGIPSGLVGVVQINFQVPASAPTGLQPLTVTVNGVTSASVGLQVTP